MNAQFPASAAPVAATATARWVVPLLAFLTVFLDGYDTTIIGFVIPTLSKAWNLPPAAFTASLVMTSVGAVVGYAISGRLAARLGRRHALLASVAWFGVWSCATALASSLVSLAALRFITSVGLGSALPVAVALAAGQVSPRRRETVTIAVVSGLSFGAVIGGIAASKLVVPYGWPSLFWLGGILPLVLLLPALWLGIEPDTRERTPSPGGAVGRSDERVSVLLQHGLRARTLALWTFSFFLFIAVYAMTSWIPSLLAAMGFAPNEAPLGGAAFGGGGLIGAILLVPLSALIGTRRVLALAMLGALALLYVASTADLSHSGLLLCVGGLGAFMVAGTIGQSALAVSIYPETARTSGVGWSAAVGRLGSIIGPAAGGALLASGVAPREVVFSASLPVLIALVGVLVFSLLFRKSPSEL